jgi:23S rRNA pseudouridine2605 synthase
MIRLNKFIAESGHCSRRAADELISQGKVTVNNVPIKELGTKIDADIDEVRIKNGPKITLPKKKTTIMLYKSKNYVCTKTDPNENPTIYATLPKELQHLQPIGGFDRESEGLLLMTDDHDLKARLEHDKILREYQVIVRGKIDDKQMKTLQKGMYLRESVVKLSSVRIVSYNDKDDRTLLNITATDPKTKPIYDAFVVLKRPVKKLIRIAYGDYKLGKMTIGDFKVI